MRPWLAVLLTGCTGVLPEPSPTVSVCAESGRLARLSGTQYRAVVARVLPEWKPLDALEVPFSQPRRTDVYSTWSSQASLGEYDVDDAWSAAELIATEWVERQQRACPGAGRSEACVVSAWKPFVSALWSRPPTSEELASITQSLAEYERDLPGKPAAVAMARALLMSPQFLFRQELGIDGALDAYELAAAVSFTLTDAPPDEPLRRLVESGAAPGIIAGEASRLLAQPTNVPALRRFLREFLQYETAAQTFKDPAQFPFHRPRELVDDTERVVERLLERHARSGLQRALLTSTLVHVRPSTARSWGLQLTADAGVFLDDPSRTGVLSHPSWLVAMSEPDHNHLVRRGRFVREKLLCGQVPNLPGGVVPQIEKKPGLTFRQRLEQHSTDPACAGCHQLMDPLGMGFEAWDHLGRAQTMDNGGPVSTSGLIEGAGDQDGPYADTRELMKRLADAPEVRACWVRQVFQYFRGRPIREADLCELERLTQLYEDSGEDTLAVIEALFESPAFLNRQVLR